MSNLYLPLYFAGITVIFCRITVIFCIGGIIRQGIKYYPFIFKNSEDKTVYISTKEAFSKTKIESFNKKEQMQNAIILEENLCDT
jgi:hypothetical protein